MKNFAFKSVISLFCLAFLVCFAAPNSANAQRRDYMTEPESEIVRESQEIDLRIMVLTKMIDRRFAILSNEQIKPEKNSDRWGEPPTGTRLELLSDINKLLQKAIDDIDDVAAHNRMDSKLFPKAMRNLTEAAARYQLKIKAIFDQNPSNLEKGLLLGASEFCDTIIEAAAKVPKEAPKEEKKKKKKNDTK
jgi:hypothetical protein